MRRNRGFVLLALLLSFGLFAAACGSDSKSSSSSSASSASSSQNVPQGGTLTIGAEQEPDCFDWISACAGNSWGYWMITVNTMPRAFDILKDDNGDYSYVASSVLAGEPTLETTPVQKITYKINPKAVWSDGTPITSADFQYTWDQVANTQDVYDTTGYTSIASVDATDPSTAVVTMKSGEVFSDWKLLFTSNYGIFPSHILKGQDRDAMMKDGYKFSGGPWMIDSWTKTDSVVLVPNPKYWGDKPKLDKVIFKFIPDTAAEFTAFKSNQVDAIYPQPQIDGVDQINAGLPNTQKDISTATANFEGLWLNQAAAPFDDPAVRKAVGYAIDRNAIVKRLFGGLGVETALQYLQAGVAAKYNDTEAFKDYDLDLAKEAQLLTGAGWAKGSDGIYAKNGQRLSFTVRTTTNNKRRELTQQILQQQFQAAGMEMKSDKNATVADMFGTIAPTGDFQAAIYAQTLTSLGPSSCNLFCSKYAKPIGEKGGVNYTRTNIPDLDVPLLKMDSELDDTKLKAEGIQASKIIAENAVSFPIDPLPTILLWHDKVVGPLAGNGLLGPFWNLNQWGVTG